MLGAELGRLETVKLIPDLRASYWSTKIKLPGYLDNLNRIIIGAVINTSGLVDLLYNNNNNNNYYYYY